jgi:hypothetical protein
MVCPVGVAVLLIIFVIVFVADCIPLQKVLCRVL